MVTQSNKDAGLKSDEESKFEAIYEASCEPVLAYVLRRTDPHNALDVVAETWLVAWRRLPEIPRSNLPWLLGVARNILVNQRRSDMRLDTLRQKLRSHRLEETSLLEGSEAIELGEAIEGVLEKLPPKDREVLCLVAWEGLKPNEAAAVMGYTTPAFSVRLHRARKRFIKGLEAIEAQPATVSFAPRSRDEA